MARTSSGTTVLARYGKRRAKFDFISTRSSKMYWVLIAEADGHRVWKYELAMAFAHDQVARHGFHAGRMPYRHR